MSRAPRRPLPRPSRAGLACVAAVCAAAAAGAAEPASPPAPDWKLRLGLSYLGTSGNSETSSGGLDVAYGHRWDGWALDASAKAVRVSESDQTTAERLAGELRARRRIAPSVELTLGGTGERDRFAGVDFRSVTDAGVVWSFLATDAWKADVLASLSWNHEQAAATPGDDYLGGLVRLSALRKLSETAELSAEAALSPSLEQASNYRLLGRLGAQASLVRGLALKLAYEIKYDNRPVVGFETTDTAVSASVVLKLGRQEAK